MRECAVQGMGGVHGTFDSVSSLLSVRYLEWTGVRV